MLPTVEMCGRGNAYNTIASLSGEQLIVNRPRNRHGPTFFVVHESRNDRAARLAAIPAGASPANRRRSSHCCIYIQRRGGRPIRRKPGSKSPRGLGHPVQPDGDVHGDCLDRSPTLTRPNSQMSPIADAPNISRIAQLTKPMTIIGMSSRRIIFAPSIPGIRNCLPGHCKIATQPLTDIFASPRRSLCSLLEPVSVGHRTGLSSRRQFLPGNGLARPETTPGFLATNSQFRATETHLSRGSLAKAPDS
jgi:hypothetical protein